jgi:hypothetical protein
MCYLKAAAEEVDEVAADGQQNEGAVEVQHQRRAARHRQALLVREREGGGGGGGGGVVEAPEREGRRGGAGVEVQVDMASFAVWQQPRSLC